MAIKYDREGKMLAVAALDGSINVWSMDENGKFTEVALLKASTTTPTTCSTISWDPVNDYRLASIYGDGQLRIWDIKKAVCLFTTGISSRPLLSLSWSPDGKYIAVSDKDDLLSFVETANKFKVCRRMKFEYFIFEMLWTKDSSHFLIANGNNARTGGEVEVYKMVPEEKSLVTKVFVALGHTAHCNTFTMNKEGSVLVTGGLDALVCIWDVNEMVCHTTISRFKYPVRYTLRRIFRLHSLSYLNSPSLLPLP
jgi:THO complex subunit 3